MEKIALIKLHSLLEQRMCKEIAGLPTAKTAHPLEGEFDVMVILGGKEPDIINTLTKIKGFEDVKELHVSDKTGMDFTDLGKEEHGHDLDFKRTSGGAPFILCPECGNESWPTAMTALPRCIQGQDAEAAIALSTYAVFAGIKCTIRID